MGIEYKFVTDFGRERILIKDFRFLSRKNLVASLLGLHEEIVVPGMIITPEVVEGYTFEWVEHGYLKNLRKMGYEM